MTSGGRLPTLTPLKVLQTLERIGFVRVWALGSPTSTSTPTGRAGSCQFRFTPVTSNGRC
jgi:hypothetical protein